MGRLFRCEHDVRYVWGSLLHREGDLLSLMQSASKGAQVRVGRNSLRQLRHAAIIDRYKVARRERL